jgi:hypothetical protein
MNTLKPFDPDDIDETLTRVVTLGTNIYLLFPYINAVDAEPKFDSISCVIDGPAATVNDFQVLSASVKRMGEKAKWLISFNTPWLVSVSSGLALEQRRRQSRGGPET